VIAMLLLGLGCGVGLLVAMRAVRPRPMPLGPAVRSLTGGLDRGRGSSSLVSPARAGFGGHDVRTRGVGALADRTASPRVERDLRILGIDRRRHAVDQLRLAVCLAAVVAAGGLVFRVLDVGPPVGLVMVGTGVAGVAGFLLPEVLLRSHAANRRRQFTFALSSYLDLVNVLLAGGAGVETALHATADAGSGWAFAEIRNALVRATTTRRSPWAALAELGDQLGVDELVELAASLQLAGEEGARIRSSLAAKASSLRGRQLAQIEAEAHAASERMGFPTVAMFLGFLALLAYPAVQQIVGS